MALSGAAGALFSGREPIGMFLQKVICITDFPARLPKPVPHWSI